MSNRTVSQECCCASGAADAQPQDSQDKLRIQVDQSRVSFGVADSAETLEHGQCFFQPTMDDLPHVFSDTYVLVVCTH